MYTTPNQPFQPTDISRFKTLNQENPSSLVSNQYEFISTKSVLAILADYGWFPYQVREARTRIEENQGYQKHAITLFNSTVNDTLAVGETLPQILLTNSHSGTASFQFRISLLEKVCSNGLIVEQAHIEGLRVSHRGNVEHFVSGAIQQIILLLPQVLEQVERFKQIKLDDKVRLQFAEEAIQLRFDEDQYRINPSDLLYVRRRPQQEPTLWNTFNVIQEAVIRGGVRQQRRDGSRIRSRAIHSIDENIRLNSALWRLAEATADRVSL